MSDKFQILKDMAREYNPNDMSLEEYTVKLANDYSKVCKNNYKLQQQRDLYKSVIDKIENKCEEIIENNKYSYLSSTNDILTAIGETDTARAIKKILFEYKANIKEDRLGGDVDDE